MIDLPAAVPGFGHYAQGDDRENQDQIQPWPQEPPPARSRGRRWLGLAAAGAVLAGAGLVFGGYPGAVLVPAAAFVVVWYSLGVAMCVALGALLGPRILRW